MSEQHRETKESGWILRSNLREATFRANPDYRFVLLKELPEEQQQLLGPLGEDADLGGLLQPREPNGILTAKAVCHQTATLFSSLQTPGRLTEDTLASLGADGEQTLRQFVLDGILEFAVGETWRSGPAACVLSDNIVEPSSLSVLARLSSDAIEHVASIHPGNAAECSTRLYQFNTLPLTPSWIEQLRDEDAVLRYLKLDAGAANRSLLDRHWIRIHRGAEPGEDSLPHPWLGWSSRHHVPPAPGTVHYKLYFSPRPDCLPESMQIWLRALSASGAHHFKAGASARGLLRPDKVVAYFTDRQALESAAARMARELSGCPAQGVPFTAELGSDALLSWGSDPPVEGASPPWLSRQSWRLWIANRIALALMLAMGNRGGKLISPQQAAQFAKERLRLEGVDTETWAPVSTSWQREAAERIAS